LHSYEKAGYLEESSDAAIDVIIEHQARKVSALVPADLRHGRATATSDPGRLGLRAAIGAVAKS